MEDNIKSFKRHLFRHTFACPYTVLVFFLEKPELSPVFVYLFFGASVGHMRQSCPSLHLSPFFLQLHK